MLMLPSALMLAVSPVASLPTTDLPGSRHDDPAIVAYADMGDETSLAAPPSDLPPAGPVAPSQVPPPGTAPNAAVEAGSPGQAPPADPAQNEIVITGRSEAAGDPLRAVNAEAFSVTQKVDDAVIGPAAQTYKENVPGPVRKGIHNFLYNLREPVVFLNFMLQLKPGKAAETLGRFAINSTVGVAGLVDVAKRKPFHLPRRANGFADTMGYYGVKPGAFLFLPLIGPTTVRDLIGGGLDRLVLPAAVGSPFDSLAFTVPAGALGALDHRSRFNKTLKDLHDNSPDPYAATRAFYLNRRQAEIDQLRGRVSGDPAGMSGPPPSVAPFVPSDLAPASAPEPPAVSAPGG
jgi:phospholipid-binding lipoprotein MlaA